MTEDEAKKKWCPYVKDKKFINGDDCIGSNCMMWVWGDPIMTDADHRANSCGGNCKGTPQGHCGLAK